MRQFIFIIASALSLTLANVATADCVGTDLIAELSPPDQQNLDTRLDQTPYPDGLLWQAKRGDLTLTLFGTYHLKHRETAQHLAELTPLIARADEVLLEMNPEDTQKLQAELAGDPSLLFITSGPTLPDLLGETDWQRYASQMQARHFPAVMASRFKPSWAAMMLGISPCEAESGALSGDGIDSQIGDYATAHHIPTRSLEDYHTALTLLDDMPLDQQLELIRMMLDWPGDPDDMAYTLREAYLAQHTGLIWAFSALQAEQDGSTDQLDIFQERLLTRRNQAWVRLIDAESGAKDIFMAVGALHLPGETGVLNLLTQHGFTVTALPFAM